MPDLLLFLPLILAPLVVVCLVLRWAARAEQRADARRLMNRVYYPKRGRKAGVPTLERRQSRPGRNDGAVLWH